MSYLELGVQLEGSAILKSYMSHLQQYTKIIKIPTLQTYLSLKFIKIEVYTK
jgi:hypothetical protein